MPKTQTNIKNNTTLRFVVGVLLCALIVPAALKTLFETTNVSAAGIPTVSVTPPTKSLIGSNFTMGFTFDNTSSVDTGYGPYIDIVLPTEGADGDGVGADDGISFVGATVFAQSVNATQFTFPGPGPTGCINHPFQKLVTGLGAQVCGNTGNKIIVLQLPFGSFAPDQSAVTVQATFAISSLADLAPLTIESRGGFRYGNDEFDNPTTDPSIITSFTNTSVTPDLIDFSKTTLSAEGETASGPNYVRKYNLSATIANGQVFNNFQFVDELPKELVYKGNVVLPSGCTIAQQPALNVTSLAPNNKLIVNCASLVGTGAALSVVFDFYVSDIDANGVRVLPAAGGNKIITNSANATGNWQPLDTRDSLTPYISPTKTSTIEAKTTTTQKSVAIVSNFGDPSYTPGDIIEYTIDYQLSDYFAGKDFVFTDVIPDGIKYVPGFTPTFSIATNGYASSTSVVNTSNYTFVDNSTPASTLPNDGTKTLTINISNEIISRSLQAGGIIVGGCVNTSGGVLSPCNTTTVLGATSAQIKFRAEVDDQYTDTTPFGFGAVGNSDVINNTVLISDNVLDNATLTNVLGPHTDNSQAPIQIAQNNIAKSIYAVNGITGSTYAEIGPPDEVTYRIQYILKSGDNKPVELVDTLPLPVYGLTTFSTAFNTAANASVPAVDTAKCGPSHTYKTTAGTCVAPSITLNTPSNQIIFNYPAFSDSANASKTIDLLFTVKVSSSPIPNNLDLTNLIEVREDIVPGGQYELVDQAINQVRLKYPELKVSKGIVDSDSPTKVFSSVPFAAPVNFAPVSSAGCPSFSGTISSDYLLNNNPINSDISGVDGGDRIRYAAIIENTGGSASYNIRFKDVLPIGLTPDSPSNICIRYGDGTLAPFAVSGSGMFGSGAGDYIQLTDPGATTGALAPLQKGPVDNTATGLNIIVITYDVIVANTIDLTTQPTNEFKLTNFTATPLGLNIAVQPKADSTITLQGIPTVTKSITSVDYSGASISNLTDVVPGSIITYQATATLREGLTKTVSLKDTLDAGLAFKEITSITNSANLTSSIGVITGITPFVSPSGTDFTLTFGDITNTDTNNTASETITVTYSVVVLSTTNRSELKNNSISTSWAGGANVSTASATEVIVKEPEIIATKTATPVNPDYNDALTYTVVVSCQAGADRSDCNDITFIDPISTNLTFVPGSFVNTAGVIPDVGSLQFVSPSVQASFAKLTPGQTSTLVYQAIVTQATAPGTTILNTATLNTSSKPGLITISQTAFNASGVEKNYSATGVQNISANNPSITKTVDTSRNDLDSTGAGRISTGNNVVIGEIARYTVSLVIPEGQMPGAVLVDTLPLGMSLVGGISLLPSSSNLTTNIGGGYAGALAGLTYDDNTRILSVPLGTLNNIDTNNAVSETITFVYDAVVNNVSGNQAGTTLTNTAQINWTANAITLSVAAISPTLTIVEPVLTVSKTSSTASVQIGSQTEYTITLTNTGNSKALEAVINDIIPNGLNYIPASISITGNSPYGSTTNVSVPTLSWAIDQIDPGQTVILKYRAEVDTSAIAFQSYTNSVTVRYTSLTGDVTTSLSPFNPTSVERTGNIGGPGTTNNDYQVTSSVSITVLGPSVIKSTVSTSEASTTGANVAIGESVRYRIVMDVPQATTPGLILRDLLPNTMRYTGSAKVALVSNGSTAMTSSIVSGANIPGFVVAVPTVSMPAAGINQLPGGDVEFNFGTVVNSDSDVDSEFIVLEFDAVVTNDLANQSTISLENIAQLFTGGVLRFTTAPVPVTVVEPSIKITKTNNKTNPVIGDVVTYTLLVEHFPTSSADAFEATVSDTLPSGLNYVPGSLTSQGPWVSSISLPVLTLNTTQFSLGTVSTITYQVTVTNTGALTNFINNASVTWNSLPGSNLDKRTSADGVGSGLNNYASTVSSSSQLTAPDPTVTLSDGVISTTPGSTSTYLLSINNLGNTISPGSIVTITIPPNTSFAPATSSPGWSCTPNNLSGSICTLTVGNLPTLAPITRTFDLIVDPSVPANASQISVSASISNNGSNGSDLNPANNTSSDIDTLIAAPDITVTKTVAGTVSPGNTIIYSVILNNVGNQTALNTVILESLPANSTFVATSSDVLWSFVSPNYSIQVPIVLASQTLSYNFAVKISETIFASSSTLTNTVTANDDGTQGADNIPANNIFSLSSPVLPNSNSIAGKLFNDLNGNDLFDTAESYFAGVQINLYRSGFGPDGIPANADDEQPVASALSDSLGNYTFTSSADGVDSDFLLDSDTNTLDAVGQVSNTGLISGASYSIRQDRPSDSTASGLLFKKLLSSPNTGSDDAKDSDVILNGLTPQITLILSANASSQNNDFGYTAKTGLVFNKTVYKGHSLGAGCPGVDLLTIVDKTRTLNPITYCFVITNTGDTYLTNPSIIDATLGINQTNMTVLAGVLPLAPGATLTYYYEMQTQNSINNSATASAIPSTILGDPTGQSTVTKTDENIVVEYVFDPPIGIKTGVYNGLDKISWRMIWINTNTSSANNVIISDEPPVGTVYADNLACVPRGVSVVVSCIYNPPSLAFPRGQVVAIANIGPNPGVVLPELATNAIEVRFDVGTLLRSGSIENQGKLSWDPDSDGIVDFVELTRSPGSVGATKVELVLSETGTTSRLYLGVASMVFAFACITLIARRRLRKNYTVAI